ncbi:neural cell adhesion molecule 1-like [Ylistrum balloti]|uniref:neural cell adhesion molecule 1-like n=1 Tax=Ylistrum balloti TaxID=509963 RepID=UPI002905CE4C|nr:neural cell adhesion molecule 1-like [Ylistrum balloti]
MVPRQVFVAEFEDIEINCTVVSYTEITEVIWRRGDDTILSNSSILYLKNTSRGDMGLYFCQSKNRIDAEIQTMSKVTKLHVEYPPIAKVPDNTTADDQEDVILHCIVDSHPESTITWYSPDNEVLSNTSMLELKNVNRSYIGNYTCKGQNVVKGSTRSDRSTTYLFVNCKLEYFFVEYAYMVISMSHEPENSLGVYDNVSYKNPDPPVVEVPSNITVNDQDDLILQCIVNSYPPSSVTWYSPDTKKISNTSMLELKNVSRTYIGEYTCRAENEIQGLTFTTSNSTLLFVNFAPVVVVSHNTTAVEFQDIVIDCKVVSYPMSTVTWQNYNNQDISNSSGLLLKYVRPKDEGIYTCTAENVIQGNHHTRSASTTLYITQTKQHCRCNRRCTYLKNILNITMEQARNAMEQIKKELTVEPTTLTSYIIKKISMKNSNTSSIGFGVIAIMIIILVFGFLVGGDIIKLAKYLHDCRRLELKEVKTVNKTSESKEIRAKTNRQRKKRKLKKCKGDKENEGLNPKYRTLKKL